MARVYINYFEFQNFRKYKDFVKFFFTTNQKKYNFKETVNSVNFQHKNQDYNTALGIIGGNTSGKSTILFSFNIYKAFNIDGLFQRKRVLTRFGINEGNYRVIEQFDFNNINEPIIFKIHLTTEKNNFFHEIKFFKNDIYHEKITVIKKKKEKVIWTQNSDTGIKFNFLKYFNILNSQFIDNVNLITINEELAEFGKNLNQLLNNFYFFNSERSKQELIIETLDQISWSIYEDKNKQKIKDKIELLLTTIDNSIEKINFESVTRGNQIESLSISSIQLKTKATIPVSFLSSGTLKFISEVLPIIRNLEKNENFYYFIDELDNSWHPNLTIFFIKLFQKKIFNNSTLIFTAHNPYIFNELRKDSIYFIDDNSELIHFNEYYNNNLTVRNDFRFSKNYFEEKIGSFPNKEKIENFYKEIIK